MKHSRENKTSSCQKQTKEDATTLRSPFRKVEQFKRAIYIMAPQLEGQSESQSRKLENVKTSGCSEHQERLYAWKKE